MMNKVKIFLTACMAVMSLSICFSCSRAKEEAEEEEVQVLVFSKTAGFRHDAIEKGAETLKELGKESGFGVVHSEDASMFTSDQLDRFAAIVFLNTTGDILNSDQQAAMERYIQSGGGFLGVHAAADTEYDWPWYGQLVGAYFLNHPEQQDAVVFKTELEHASTAQLPDRWERWDEWYSFKDIQPDIKVLLKLDESTYKGGENGDNHPIAWFKEFDGGRSYYTGMGHTKESYDDPAYRKHLLEGLMYVMKRP